MPIITEIGKNQAIKQLINSKSGSRTYLVSYSASESSSIEDVLSLSTLPQVNSIWAGMPCKSRDIKLMQEDEDHDIYLVQLNYDDNNDSSSDDDDEEDDEETIEDIEVYPWQEDANLSFSPVVTQKVLEYDYSDDRLPILNSALDHFIDMPLTDVIHGKVSIKYASLNFAQSSINLFGSINQSSITIGGYSIASKCGRLISYNVSTNKYTDKNKIKYDYYDINIEIEIVEKPEDFVLEILDSGYHEWLWENGVYKKVKMLDVDKKAYSTPQLLDGHGNRLSKTADPVYLKYQQYPIKDWGILS